MPSVDDWNNELEMLRDSCDVIKALASSVYAQDPERLAACHAAVDAHWTKVTAADYGPEMDIRQDLVYTLTDRFPQVLLAFFELAEQLENESQQSDEP